MHLSTSWSESPLDLAQGLWDQVLEIGECCYSLLTSDRAAPVVPWNPGQGDGRGRGFGDSEAGLVRGDCETKPPTLSGKGMEGPNMKVLALPHPSCLLFPPQHPGLAFSVTQAP